jgi:hypothetical protein
MVVKHQFLFFQTREKQIFSQVTPSDAKGILKASSKKATKFNFIAFNALSVGVYFL